MVRQPLVMKRPEVTRPWDSAHILLDLKAGAYHQRILFKFFTVSEHLKKSSFLKSAFNPQIIFFHLYSLDSEKREDFCVCVLLSVGSLSSHMINTHLKILICCYPFEKLKKADLCLGALRLEFFRVTNRPCERLRNVTCGPGGPYRGTEDVLVAVWQMPKRKAS